MEGVCHFVNAEVEYALLRLYPMHACAGANACLFTLME